MTTADDSFLSRWAKRKAQVRSGIETPAEAPVAAVAKLDGAMQRPGTAPSMSMAPAGPVFSRTPVPVVEPPPLPTMDDVARLTRGSDFASFVQPGIDPGVSNAAMKKLFSDPRYNVMDGLDTYIGDYNTPDPIPLSMLRQMNQANFLGLFDDEDQDQATTRRDDRNDGHDESARTAAVTAAAASSAAAIDLRAQDETGAPADAPESFPDDDTDL